MSSPAATRRVRIARKRHEAQDVVGLELVDPMGDALPPFSAGSHIDVHVAAGIVRQYSLCNAPGDFAAYQIAVLKEPTSRGGSVAMHALEVGDIVEISEPKNHFPLAHDAKRSVLFAGGIGITPILCMAERLCATGSDFTLHYCSRSRDRTAFVDRIAGSPIGARTQFHYDDGPAELRLKPERAVGAPAPDTHLYVCGPAGFMDWVLGTARGMGWPEERLHREYFAAAPVAGGGDGIFEVQVASSGKVIHVAADQTVVAALAAAGIDVPTSCEQGVCGTCLTRVIDGTPDHRDLFLTEQEQSRGDQFLPCCSRSKSPRLVLDL